MSTPLPKSPDAAAAPEAVDTPASIYLVSYPKIVFLYPAYIMSILAGLVVWLMGENSRGAELVSLGFLMLLALNLAVIAFDFPRTTSLTLFFAFSAIGMGVVLLLTFHPDLVPVFSDVFKKLKPHANTQFYFLFAGFMTALYFTVWLMARFDYWEVRANELLHHHGFLSDMERFAAPNLRISKEINDVFEYMLLRSGRLILHPTNEPRAFVLDNVLNINKKEDRLTKMLGALQVQFRSEPPPPQVT